MMSPVIDVRGLGKSFPGVQALDGVDMALGAGEVHAVLGENGAGKSTLVKVLIGLHQPDAGRILFKGQPVRFRKPHDALALGIAMIHQELMMFPALTVAENIFVGREPPSRIPGWVDVDTMNRDASRILEKLGVPIAPTRRVGTLSVAEQQTVEIARALAHRADVLIMDEPTSALSEAETERLFDIIDDLTRQGVAVVYISHKLEEVFRIADWVTVLRDGRRVAERPVAGLDRETLIALMVGRTVEEAAARTGTGRERTALSLRDFSRAGWFHDINLDVRHGEVLGIAGLMGAGRTELVSAIYGLPAPDAGTLTVHGREVRVTGPRDAIAHGIAMVTEDRKAYGLVPGMSMAHNITLSHLDHYCRAGFVQPEKEGRAVDASITSFRIKTSGPTAPAEGLSGGNQQKVLLARALLTEPDILILDEPTRGIDVGAKAEIYDLIGQLAAAGKAILMVSSELPELLALTDRILVLRDGRISATLNTAAANSEEILHHAMPA